MTKKFDFLVFIGRMQPPTKAHKAVIEIAAQQSEKVIVVLGSANSPRTLRNPFTFEERRDMVLSCFDLKVRAQLIVVPQNDYTYNDNLWCVKLQEVVRDTVLKNIEGNTPNVTLHGINDVKVGLIGHAKDSTSYYLKLFPNWASVNVGHQGDINATEVRNAYFEGGTQAVDASMLPKEIMHNLKAFEMMPDYIKLVEERAFVIKYKKSWAAAPYPVTLMCVDAVVVQSGQILMVKRRAAPGKGMWALPGGYIDQSETLRESMLRELREETGLKVPEPVLRGSIVCDKTFDDPHRSPRGRVITTAFLIHLTPDVKMPKIRKQDAEGEVSNVEWVQIADLDPLMIFEDHYHIIQNMVARI